MNPQRNDRIVENVQSRLYPYYFAFSTNIMSFASPSAYSILGNEEFVTLNSWV
ncbi:hypothetical protein AMTRI_Chr12g275640 [Amborella trichopoda]